MLSEKERSILLNVTTVRKEVKVVPTGEHLVQYQDYQDFFGVPYLPHILFKSGPLLDLVIKQCPWTFRLGYYGIKEDYEYYRDQIWKGTVADITIGWIDDALGYGLYANQNLPKGAFIAAYTGVVRPVNPYRYDHNPYCLHYPTRFWSYEIFVIDAGIGGNESRFANHSDFPNMNLECLYDRGLLFFFLRANQPICKGMHLTFNYGEYFWRERVKVPEFLRAEPAV